MRRGQLLWLGGALVVLVVAAFSPALRNGFVWDDINNIVISKRLHDWSALLEVFRRPAMWVAEHATGPVGTYRPFGAASLLIDYQMYGSTAWGFHLTSILLHAATQLAVFGVFLRLFGRPWVAFGLATICALHPSSVEAVVWIDGRSEVLALLFGATALLAVGSIAPARARGAATGVLLLGAMLSKETGAVFVPLAAWLAGLPRGALGGGAPGEAPSGAPLRWRADVPTIAGGVLAVVVYVALRLNALGAAVVPMKVDWARVAALVPALWFRALQAAAVPLDRAPVTVGRWALGLPAYEQALYAFGSAGILLSLAVLWRRGHVRAVFGLLWWLLALAPVVLVIVLPWPGLNRWLYIGLPGLLIGLYHVVGPRLGDRTQLVAWVLTAAVALGLTERAIPVWRDDLHLFATMIEESPDDPFGYAQIGVNLMVDARWADAAHFFQQALRRDPRMAEIYGSLALCFARIGECDVAVGAFARFGRYGPVSRDAFSEAAADCFVAAGRPEEAEPLYRQCARTRPVCEVALRNLESESSTE